VASIDAYLRYAEAIGITAPVSRPALEPAREGPLPEPRTRVPRETQME
jgi:hypothetical protein